MVTKASPDVAETSADRLQENAAASGAVAIDYGDGATARLTLTGNVTSITITNWPAAQYAARLALYLTQDATGGRTINWGSVNFGTAGAPTLSGADKTDVVILTTFDGGTTIFGFVSGLDF